MSAASFVNNPTNPATLELPHGRYDFCYSWDDVIENVNGTNYQRYKHKVIKNVIVTDNLSSQSVSISPGLIGKKGTCDRSRIDGEWIGMANPDDPVNCQSADLSVSINGKDFIGSALLEDGSTVKIRAKIAPDGSIRKGAFAVGKGVAAKFSGIIDFDNKIGAGRYKEKLSKCTGVFEIEKSDE